MIQTAEESLSRFISSLAHLFGSFAPYFLPTLITVCLLKFVPFSYYIVIPIAFLAAAFPPMNIIFQLIVHRPKKSEVEWHERSLTLQVIYASRRCSLADHSPNRWCRGLLKDQEESPSWFDRFLTRGALPWIVTITTLEKIYRRLTRRGPDSCIIDWRYLKHLLMQLKN